MPLGATRCHLVRLECYWWKIICCFLFVFSGVGGIAFFVFSSLELFSSLWWTGIFPRSIVARRLSCVALPTIWTMKWKRPWMKIRMKWTVLLEDQVWHMVLFNSSFILYCIVLLYRIYVFYVLQVQSPCHHGRECFTSTNRSKRRLLVIQSINQAITYYRFLLIVQINQLRKISKWVFSLNYRFLQVLIVFCTVLDNEKSNGTVRWGRECGGGRWGEPSLGTGY